MLVPRADDRLDLGRSVGQGNRQAAVGQCRGGRVRVEAADGELAADLGVGNRLGELGGRRADADPRRTARSRRALRSRAAAGAGNRVDRLRMGVQRRVLGGAVRCFTCPRSASSRAAAVSACDHPIAMANVTMIFIRTCALWRAGLPGTPPYVVRVRSCRCTGRTPRPAGPAARDPARSDTIGSTIVAPPSSPARRSTPPGHRCRSTRASTAAQSPSEDGSRVTAPSVVLTMR